VRPGERQQRLGLLCALQLSSASFLPIHQYSALRSADSAAGSAAARGVDVNLRIL
jgi:hypothetical protein